MDDEYPKAIHDYTKKELYVDHGQDAIAWAWEFLRRNAAYQEACDDEERAVQEAGPDRAARLERRRHFQSRAQHEFGVTKLHDYRREYRHFPTEDGETRGSPPDLFYPRGWVRGDTIGPWQVPYNGRAFNEAQERIEQLAERGQIMVFAFDLAENIDAQLYAVKQELRQQAVSAGIEPDPAKLPRWPPKKTAVRMLRVLDGVGTGASPVDIKRALGFDPNSESTLYTNALNSGRRYRDVDYRALTFKVPDKERVRGGPPRPTPVELSSHDQQRLEAMEARSQQWHEDRRKKNSGDTDSGVTPPDTISTLNNQNDTEGP